MTDDPREPLEPDIPWRGDEPPPEPDEPPPAELWRVVGDVPPWGTMLLLLGWGVAFAWLAAHREIGDAAAYVARGGGVVSRRAAEVAPRLLASTFLHAGLSHLLWNAASMLVFGPAVERIFARAAFWIVYAGGGALASLASVAWNVAHAGPEPRVSIGASGAIFALGGALLAAAFRLRHRLAPGRARALAAATLFLALPALAAGLERLGTDNAAHAGGFAAGLALGVVLPLSPRLGGGPTGAVVRALGVAGALALALALARVLRGA